MNKQKVQHIFFDLDNTLWDHRGNSEITLKNMFLEHEIQSKYNLSFDTWHPVFYEKNELLWEQIREGHITKAQLREKRFKEPFTLFGLNDESLWQTFEYEYLSRMGKMSGIVENADIVLDYLKLKYQIHVITNGFEEVSQAKIANSALNGFIETLTCADELNLRKPDPRIFDLAMQKAGATKENSLIIGDDWIADIIGGTSFGWQAIFFDTLNDENQLDEVENIKNLIELKALL